MNKILVAIAAVALWTASYGTVHARPDDAVGNYWSNFGQASATSTTTTVWTALDAQSPLILDGNVGDHDYYVTWNATTDSFAIKLDGTTISDLTNSVDSSGRPAFAGSVSGVALSGYADLDSSSNLMLELDASDTDIVWVWVASTGSISAATRCACVGRQGPAFLRCTVANCTANTACAGTTQTPTGNCKWIVEAGSKSAMLQTVVGKDRNMTSKSACSSGRF